jgi:hypothetical protein
MMPAPATPPPFWPLAPGLSPPTSHLSRLTFGLALCVRHQAVGCFKLQRVPSRRTMSWAAPGFCYVTDDPAKTPSTFAAPVLPADAAVRIISKKPQDGLWHSACIAVSLLRFDSSLAAPSATCIASSEAAPCGDKHVLDPPASLP